jgi:ribosomal-protein-serine acetyltransferase
MATLIVNPKTILRSPSTDDAATLFALVDANRTYLRNWLPWLDGTRYESDTLAFIGRVVRDEEEGRVATRLIEHEGALCGTIGFHAIDALNRKCEMGYWLAENYQGRGIVTACVARMIRHAFEDRQLNRIAIHVAIGNAKSRAIPERLGFKPEGILREAGWRYDHFADLAVYSLLRSEWKEA